MVPLSRCELLARKNRVRLNIGREGSDLSVNAMQYWLVVIFTDSLEDIE